MDFIEKVLSIWGSKQAFKFPEKGNGTGKIISQKKGDYLKKLVQRAANSNWKGRNVKIGNKVKKLEDGVTKEQKSCEIF